jgi:nuclear pore complex protein Nup188
MTGSRFLNTDSLSTTDSSHEGEALSEERKDCDTCVFHYLYKLPTFPQVLPLSACTGAHAIYERQTERYGSSKTSAGPTYLNLRPIRLPRGSVLPAKLTGKVRSGDGADHIVVCWQHEHPRWKVILEVMTDYVNGRGWTMDLRECFFLVDGKLHKL